MRERLIATTRSSQDEEGLSIWLSGNSSISIITPSSGTRIGTRTPTCRYLDRAAWGRISECAMAASSASDETESRRRLVRNNDKGVVDLAGEALKDFAVLLQTELQLLRAEISEKLTFTALSAALIGAGALLLMATIVLLLQAAIASLVVAAVTLLVGSGLVWFGANRLSLGRLAPSKTLDRLQKDSNIANMR